MHLSRDEKLCWEDCFLGLFMLKQEKWPTLLQPRAYHSQAQTWPAVCILGCTHPPPPVPPQGHGWIWRHESERLIIVIAFVSMTNCICTCRICRKSRRTGSSLCIPLGTSARHWECDLYVSCFSSAYQSAIYAWSVYSVHRFWAL